MKLVPLLIAIALHGCSLSHGQATPLELERAKAFAAMTVASLPSESPPPRASSCCDCPDCTGKPGCPCSCPTCSCNRVPVSPVIQWHKKISSVRGEVLSSRKLGFVFFTNRFCVPCQNVKQHCFSHPSVMEALSQMVCGEIDTDSLTPEQLTACKITQVPTILVIDRNWSVSVEVQPTTNPQQFLANLRQATKEADSRPTRPIQQTQPTQVIQQTQPRPVYYYYAPQPTYYYYPRPTYYYPSYGGGCGPGGCR